VRVGVQERQRRRHGRGDGDGRPWGRRARRGRAHDAGERGVPGRGDGA
jgi:hypothetical protein